MTEYQMQKEIESIMKWANEEEWFRLILAKDYRNRFNPDLVPAWMMEIDP